MSGKRNNRSATNIFDSLTKEELEERIRRITLREGEFSTDELSAMLEALEKKDPISDISVERAWDTFKNEYSGKKSKYADFAFVEPTKASRFRVVSERWLSRAAIIVAVIAATMIIGTATASALGFDLWVTIATWTKETFSFVYSVDGHESQPPAPMDDRLVGLQQALDSAGIDTLIVPKWIPEGFELLEIQVDSLPDFRIFAMFENDGLFFTIHIWSLNPSSEPVHEKSNKLLEELTLNGITHYIMSNGVQNKAVWTSSNLECDIYGDVTAKEIKDIIISIY